MTQIEYYCSIRSKTQTIKWDAYIDALHKDDCIYAENDTVYIINKCIYYVKNMTKHNMWRDMNNCAEMWIHIQR